MKKNHLVFAIIIIVICIALAIISVLPSKSSKPNNKIETPQSKPLIITDWVLKPIENDISFEDINLTPEQQAYVDERYKESYDNGKGVLGYLGTLKNGDLIRLIERNESKNINIKNLQIYNLSSFLVDVFYYRSFAIEQDLYPIALASSKTTTLGTLNDNGIPIESIRKIDDNNVVVIYRAKDDKSNDEFYFYAVARKAYNNKPIYGYFEDWYLGERYVVSKSLRNADFKRVRIGDSVEKVIDIDPASRIDYECSYYNNDGTMYRLLEDGMLKISFDNDKVSAIEFHPYGDIYSNDGTEVFNILRAEKPVELPRG